MDQQAQGATPPVAEPGNGQQPAQQTQNAPAAQPNQPGQPGAPTQTPNPTAGTGKQQPSVEDLQRQVNEQNERIRVATESARHWQSQADRLRQFALGSVPQVDPIAAKAKAYAQQFGVNEEDAKIFLGMMQAEIQPIAQRAQLAEAALHGTTQVGTIMQTVASDAQFGRFMQDPEVYQGVQNMLQQAALAGQREYLNPDYAKDAARILAFDKYLLAGNAQPGAQPQATPQAQPQAFSAGMFGPQNGYRPAPAMTKQVSPEVQHFNEEIRAHYGLRSNNQ